MILNSLQEKIELLEGCLLHINRIFKHFSHKKLKRHNITLEHNNEGDTQVKTPLTDKKLPRSITINGNLPTKNYALGKG